MSRSKVHRVFCSANAEASSKEAKSGWKSQAQANKMKATIPKPRFSPKMKHDSCIPNTINVRMATNVRSMHPSPSANNAVHRKQSRGQRVTTCICPLFRASARQRHTGQATRNAYSRRDGREDSTSANPMRSSKVRYLRGAGRLGQRGGMGRGEKYRDVYLRKFQRSPKANK